MSVAGRTVLVHTPDADVHATYQPDNVVVTSKYTILNFVPKNLLKQFRRVVNVYFLVICVLQSFKAISITHGIPTTTMPLLFVLFVSAVKDAVEDIARHKADEEENRRPYSRLAQWIAENALPLVVVNGDEKQKAASRRQRSASERSDAPSSAATSSFLNTESRELRVGDVIRLVDGQAVPADLLLLASSDAIEGSASVMTANLDGETNLKPKQVPPALLGRFESLSGAKATEALQTLHLECDAPNRLLHHFEGTLHIAGGGSGGGGGGSATGGAEQTVAVPVSADNLLLRGSVLRATPWVMGVVVYSGHETKIMQNMTDPPHKMSRMARATDKFTLLSFILDICFCIGAAVVSSTWATYPQATGAWYTEVSDSTTSNFTYAVIKFFNYILVFTNYIPISLLVTQDLVKLMQKMLIDRDIEMYDEESDTPALVRCSDLNEELGQVQHVFSDKTGTLTCNKMLFACCSVAGAMYGDVSGFGPSGASQSQTERKISQGNVPMKHSSLKKGKRGSSKRSGVGSSASPVDLATSFDDRDCAFDTAVKQAFNAFDVKTGGIRSSTAAPAASKPSANLLRDFMLNLALNHTVAVDTGGAPRGEARAINARYSAAIPDEAAFVAFTRRYGITFTERSLSNVKLWVAPCGSEMSVEVLHEISFTSERRRMSVIVRFNDGSIRLFCKGADSAVEPLLATPGGAPTMRLHESTSKHCDNFASAGLRTLWVASRSISNAFYQQWVSRWNQAQTSLGDREEAVARVAAEVERELTLCGATAIDDRLQDGVPEALTSLRTAGVNVWMLTGDKVDTAVTIALSASLATPDMQLLRVCAADVSSERASADPERLQLRADGVPTASSLQRVLHSIFVDASAMVEARKASYAERRAPNASPSPTALPHIDRAVQSFAQFGHARAALVVDGPVLEGIFRAKACAKAARAKRNATSAPSGDWSYCDGLGIHATEAIVEDFLSICSIMKAVICARVSPSQKALVVALVRDTRAAPVTLAIGDGANDVAMIQQAHIGVGISGQEGLQAVNASDYAVAQFRFLSRLLLVHGRWSLRRLGILTCYMFFKNVVLVLPQAVFGIYCLMSGQTIYNDILYQSFNPLLTALPVLVFGVLDQDIDARTAEANPALYRDGNIASRARRGNGESHCASVFFSRQIFYTWLAEAHFWGLVIPLFALRTFGSGHGSRLDGLWDIGTTILIATVLVSHVRLCFEAKSWNVFYVGSVVLEVLVLIFFIVLISQPTDAGSGFWSALVYTAQGSWERIRASTVFWLLELLLVCICSFVLVPVAYRAIFCPPLRVQLRAAMVQGAREGRTAKGRDEGPGNASSVVVQQSAISAPGRPAMINSKACTVNTTSIDMTVNSSPRAKDAVRVDSSGSPSFVHRQETPPHVLSV